MRPAPARRGARAQQYMPAFRFHRRLRSAQKRALHAGPARQISRSNPVVRYCSMPGTTTWHWTCAPESRWHVLRSRRGKHMPGPIRCHGPFPQNRTARLRVSLLASFQQVPRRTSAIPAPHFGTSRAVLRQVPHRTSASPAPHFGKSRAALRSRRPRSHRSPGSRRRTAFRAFPGRHGPRRSPAARDRHRHVDCSRVAQAAILLCCPTKTQLNFAFTLSLVSKCPVLRSLLHDHDAWTRVVRFCVLP